MNCKDCSISVKKHKEYYVSKPINYFILIQGQAFAVCFYL